jgi:eukaryotic-like serine/threonine-protein kinase
LTPERWRQIQAVLAGALERDPEQREEFLAEACGGDVELQAAVATLIRADARDLIPAGRQGDLKALLDRHQLLEQFLEDGPTLPADREQTAGRANRPGQIGPYRILRELGRGGMGCVYLAEQEGEDFRRRVALKVVEPGGSGAEVGRRFREERRILAGLEHPGIARFYDAGRADDGSWFLALEYVEGEDLRAFVERRGLDVRSRVQLFLQVLDAVDFAHRRLIVHRDLKPDNVLVGADGRAKLLDFGISRILDENPDRASQVTVTELRSFTPAYASPEQLRGEPATMATDVFSAGIVLYEMLAGRRPFDRRQATSPEPDPTAPSAIATAPVLRRGLAGDLDAIVLKALRPLAESRYPSAAAFADDLRRWLAGQPVQARRGGRRYRVAKFVARHRVGVAAAAALLAAGALGTAGVAWQAREAQRQRDAAQAQLARATAANDFMEILLSFGAPEGRPFEVGDLLDQGALVAERQRAAGDPMGPDALVTVGQLFMAGQNWEKATPLLEHAVEAARKSGEPAVRARALCTLAGLRAQRGDRAAGEALMAEAFAQLPADPRYALARAACLAGRTAFDDQAGDSEAMIRDASAALDLLDQVPFPALIVRVDALGSLAYAHYLAGHTRQADEAYTKVWALFEQNGLERTTPASGILNNWATVHYRGDISRAEALYRRAVALRRSIEGPTVAPAVTFNHAGALLRLGRFDESRRLYEETIATAASRQSHRTRFNAMMELADVSIEEGDLDRAAAQLAQVARQSGHPSFDDGRRTRLLHFEGRLALARGEAAQARARFAEAALRFEQHEPKTVLRALALIGLARAEQALGRGEEALAAARRALSLAESFVEKEAPSYVVGLARLAEADVLSANGQVAAARASYRRAQDHLQRTLGPQHSATLAARKGGSG